MTLNVATTITRQNAYDDSAYKSPVYVQGNIAATLNSKSQKFVAATDMIIKSMTVFCTVMGTCGGSDIANGQIYGVKIVGGTGTLTTVFSTWGTVGAGFTNGTMTATKTQWTVASSTLNAGDVLYAQKGTDSTLQADVTFELFVVPGASLGI